MAESPVAIITGAGTGIGRATAVELAVSGWRCAIIGRRPDKLTETAALMQQRKAGAEVMRIAADLALPDAADTVVQQTILKWGDHIQALINNAATPSFTPIQHASDDVVRGAFEINAFAPLRMVRAAWPHMTGKEGGGVSGRIVNISSLAAIDPFPGLGVYGMSKSALEGLTRAINREGAVAGLRAFSIQLGPVETDMLRSVVSEKVLPRSQARQPNEIASVIAACVRGERDGDEAAPIILA